MWFIFSIHVLSLGNNPGNWLTLLPLTALWEKRVALEMRRQGKVRLLGRTIVGYFPTRALPPLPAKKKDTKAKTNSSDF